MCRAFIQGETQWRPQLTLMSPSLIPMTSKIHEWMSIHRKGTLLLDVVFGESAVIFKLSREDEGLLVGPGREGWPSFPGS